LQKMLRNQTKPTFKRQRVGASKATREGEKRGRRDPQSVTSPEGNKGQKENVPTEVQHDQGRRGESLSQPKTNPEKTGQL